MWSKCYPLSPLFQFLVSVTSRTVGIWVLHCLSYAVSLKQLINHKYIIKWFQTDKEVVNYSVFVSLLLLEEHLTIYSCTKRITEIFHRHWRVRSTSQQNLMAAHLFSYFHLQVPWLFQKLVFDVTIFNWASSWNQMQCYFLVCFGMEGEISGTASTHCHNW